MAAAAWQPRHRGAVRADGDGGADPRRLRAARARPAALRLGRRPADARRRPRRRRAARRDGARRPDVPRERPAAAAQPRRGADRRAQRARQPAPADGRPRGRARRPRPRTSGQTLRVLRPRRLQGLQRRVRPQRRRRAARAARPRRWPRAVAGRGAAYRLGGDEFCVLLDGETSSRRPDRDARRRPRSASTARASPSPPPTGSSRSPPRPRAPRPRCSWPTSACTPTRTRAARPAARQARDVLVQVLAEREPELRRHMADVAELAVRTGRELGLDAEQLDVIARAAELHDIGKVAVPDDIINKPGPLDDVEWRDHAPAHAGRRAHPGRRARPDGGRAARAPEPRALGRGRLPGRARRRGDPDRRARSSPSATPTTR